MVQCLKKKELVKTEIARQETKQAVGMFENWQWQAGTKPKRYTNRL